VPKPRSEKHPAATQSANGSLPNCPSLEARRHLAGQFPDLLASPNGMRSPWVKSGYTKSIGKSNGNCLGAARLVCMTEVSDLPNPVAGCRRPPGMRMLRRNALEYGPREKATARWTRERYA
jgi:hypothetical protein